MTTASTPAALQEATAAVKAAATTNVLGLPLAQTNPLLDRLTAELRGTRQTATVTLGEHRYVLQTLEAEDEQWADGFVQGGSGYQVARSKRVPYLAAALVSIDETPVEVLWKLPETMDPDLKRLLLSRTELETGWRRVIIRDWLSKLPPGAIDKLWAEYQALDEKRQQSLEALQDLSQRTPSGASSPTSSAERASSSPTQVSAA